MFRLFWLVYLGLWGGSLMAQTGQPLPRVYAYTWPAEAAWLGGGLALNGTYFYLHKRTVVFTEADIAALDASRIGAFDRSALRQWSPRAARWSDGLMGLAILSPAALLASRAGRSEWGGLGLMAFQTFSLATGITNVIKVSAKRTRPFNYNADAPLELKMKRDARYSYPSGHSSATAAMSFFAAKTFHDLHPQHRLRPWVWTGAVVLPATVGWLRWKAGKHFPSDIISGYVVGALVGILVPELHRRVNR